MDIIISGVAVDLEHAMDYWEFAQRPQVQLLVVLLLLQGSQRLTELIQGADGHHSICALIRRKFKKFKNLLKNYKA